MTELVRLAWSMGGLYQCETGFYTDYGKVTEVIAAEQQKAQDAEELAFRMDRFAKKYLSHMRNAEQRAEAAESKLAQYEAQEPVAWLCEKLDGDDRFSKVVCNLLSVEQLVELGGGVTPLYALPAPIK